MIDVDERDLFIPQLPRMKEIWRAMFKGGFISRECYSTTQKELYGLLNRYQDAYSSFFTQMGYYLEHDNVYGVFYLCDLEKPMNSAESKMMHDLDLFLPMCHIMDMFLTQSSDIKGDYNIDAGREFYVTSFLHFCEMNSAIQKALMEFPDAKKNSKDSSVRGFAEYFIKRMTMEGFIELNDLKSKCRVTSAYGYCRHYYETVTMLRDYAKYNTGCELAFDDEEGGGSEQAGAGKANMIDFESNSED